MWVLSVLPQNTPIITAALATQLPRLHARLPIFNFHTDMLQTCCLTKPHSMSSSKTVNTKLHKPPTNFCPATCNSCLPCSLPARLVHTPRPIQRTSGQRSVNKGTSHGRGSSWWSWPRDHFRTQAYEKERKKKKKNGNHLYWGNFFIKDMVFKKDLLIRSMQCELSVHPFKVEEKMTTS